MKFPEPEKKSDLISPQTSLYISNSERKRVEGFLLDLESQKNSAQQFLLSDEEREQFHKLCPQFNEIVKRIKNQIVSELGYIRVKGLPFLKLTKELRNAFIIAFTSLLGVPTSTDQGGKSYVWKVKPRQGLNYKNLTFSQHDRAAQFHTDTQYYPKPEQAIALWCINPARLSGGKSYLAHGNQIVNELSSGEYGKNILRNLYETQFPFRTPTAFTSSIKDDKPEVIYKPVLLPQGTVRYRLETILKGLALSTRDYSDEAIKALCDFDEYIHQYYQPQSFFLQAGEVVFVNNHHILHGRSGFDDSQRELLRIRFNLHNENS